MLKSVSDILRANSKVRVSDYSLRIPLKQIHVKKRVHIKKKLKQIGPVLPSIIYWVGSLRTPRKQTNVGWMTSVQI
jgi:hypothetical protein